MRIKKFFPRKLSEENVIPFFLPSIHTRFILHSFNPRRVLYFPAKNAIIITKVNFRTAKFSMLDSLYTARVVEYKKLDNVITKGTRDRSMFSLRRPCPKPLPTAVLLVFYNIAYTLFPSPMLPNFE